MRLRFDIKTATLLGLLLATTMGHGGGCCEDEEVLGPPTEKECPPTQTLTYENFGQAFVTDYCTDCHSSTKVGSDRNGATEDHDFDTLLGIRQVAEHIDRAAGIGPASANRNMPPDEETAQPTDEEREKLAEWIACGAPSTP
jgi:uncharacterized membrane protein